MTLHGAILLPQQTESPSGGNAGQVLAKVDGTDYNAQWVTPSGGSAIDSDWGQL